jgi:DUF4097 and DUF4098 domain-containing protein YvlB
MLPVTCCSLVLACLGVTAALSYVADQNEVTAERTETFSLQGTESPSLSINNEVGAIIVEAAPGQDSIRVEIFQQATGLTKNEAQGRLDDIQVEIWQEGDNFHLDIDNPDNPAMFSNSYTNLSVFLPPGVGLNIMTNLGRVELLDLSEGPSINISTNVGSVEAENVSAQEAINITTNVGSIDWQGPIRGAAHNFRTTTGRISVEVEEGSAFSLTAQSEVGEMQVDLELSNRQTSGQNVGGRVGGVYGPDQEPAGTLNLNTDVGAIEVQD